MNKHYRTIWNDALGAWVAVSEIEKAKGKPAASEAGGAAASFRPLTTAFCRILLALGLAFGYSAQAQAATATCQSEGSSSGSSTYCGVNATANSNQGTAYGHDAKANGAQSVAIGANVRADGASSIAIGNDDVNLVNANAQALYKTLTGEALRQSLPNLEPGAGGTTSYPKVRAMDGAIAVGVSAYANELSSAIGTRAFADGAAAVALGTGAKADKQNAVAIGAGSTTAGITAEGVTPNLQDGKYKITLNGIDFFFKSGNDVAEGDIVSFGAPGFERQLKNVAPGKVSENSTDVINGAQLYAVVDALTAAQNKVNSIETKQTHFYSIGQGLATEGNYNNDGATGAGALAAGIGARAVGQKSVAVGNAAVSGAAGKDATVAIGSGVSATGAAALAAGDRAVAAGEQAIAIGQQAQANGYWDISIGRNAGGNGFANVNQGRNIAIGDSALRKQTVTATEKDNNNIALGTSASEEQKGESNVVIGTYANSPTQLTTLNELKLKKDLTADTVSASNVVAIGTRAVAAKDGAVAIGNRTHALQVGASAVGTNAQANQSYSLAFGQYAQAGLLDKDGVTQGRYTVAIGSSNNEANKAAALNNYAIAIGYNAKAEGRQFNQQGELIVDAQKNPINLVTKTGQIAIGQNTAAYGSNSVALGTDSISRENETVAIGKAAAATVAGGIALGSDSKAVTGKGGVGVDPLEAATDKTGAAWKATQAAVSVGNEAEGFTRQINNVAAGTQDTDAVNVAQLKAAGFKLTTSNTGGGAVSGTTVEKVQNGETVTIDAGKNISLTQAENKITVATKDTLEVTSVQAGNNVFDGTAMNVGGQAYTNVAAAINALDAKPSGAGVHFYSVNGASSAGNYNNNGATGSDALAAGVGASASGTNAIAVGRNVSSTEQNALAVGVSARATGQGAISIGQAANKPDVPAGQTVPDAGTNSIAVGTRSSSQATNSIAIGTEALVKAAALEDGKVVGRGTNRYDPALLGPQLTGQGSVAIGSQSSATGTNAVALGQVAEALGQNALAAGNDSHAIGKSSVAFGDGARTENDSALAAGYAALATGANATSLGASSKAIGTNALAAGSNAKAEGVNATAVGNDANAKNKDTVAVGQSADALGDSAVAVGKNAKGEGDYAIAVGLDSAAKKDGSVAVGSGAQAHNQYATAVGNDAHANADKAAAYGREADASAESAVAVGYKAASSGQYSIAVGNEAASSGASAIAVGANSEAKNVDTMAIGRRAVAEDSNAIAFGVQSTAKGSSAIAVGSGAKTEKEKGIAIGNNTFSLGEKAVALGASAQTAEAAEQSVAVGFEARANAANSIALGYGAKAYQDGSVALGSESLTSPVVKTTEATVGGITYGGFAGNNPVATVSVGRTATPDSSNQERTITNVGAGRIGAGSTDAVNGSQLYAVADQLAKRTARTPLTVSDGIVNTPSSAAASPDSLAPADQLATAGDIAKAVNEAGFKLNAVAGEGELGAGSTQNELINAGDTVTVEADKNIKITQTGGKLEIATKDALEASSFTAGNNVLDGTEMTVNGAKQTNVAAAINALDAKAQAAKTHFYSVNGSDSDGNYNNDGATGEKALAAGVGASAASVNGIAIGSGAKALNGAPAGSTFEGNIAIGHNASADANHTVALGTGSSAAATAEKAVVIGAGASATADASGGAEKQGHSAVVVGTDASVKGNSGIAVGRRAEATGALAAAIGEDAQADGKSSLAFGNLAQTAQAAANAMAFGNASSASAEDAAAIGREAKASAVQALAFGSEAKAQSKQSIALGVGATTDTSSSNNAVAIGTGATARGQKSLAIGAGAQTGKPAIEATETSPPKSAVRPSFAVAIGDESKAEERQSVAIGHQSQTTVQDGVALGSLSIADTDKGKVGVDPLGAVDDKTGSVWTSTRGAVSVGNDARTSRQITHVAAGTEDGDAVNVAQLKAAGFKLAAANAGGGESNSVADDRIQNGETVTFDAGKNISITHTANTVGIATKDNVEFTTVAAQDAQGNRTEINGSGMTITPNGGSNPVKLTSDGLDNGGKVIANVGNGKVESGSKEAVTGDQLFAVQQQLNDSVGNAGKGLNFTGNSGNFNRKLGENVTVKGGLDNTAAASNSNIRTVADSTGNIEILLADAPTFAGKVSAKGLDAGNQKITGVLKGDQDADAVNVKQLKEAIDNANVTTQNIINANSPFSYVNGAGEMLNRSISPDGTVKFTKANDGSEYTGKDVSIAALNAEDPQSAIPTAVTNVKAGAGDTEAVNVSQLKNTVKALGGGAAVNPDGTVKDPVYTVNTTAGGNSTVNNVGDALAALNAEVLKPLAFKGDNDAVKVERKLGEELTVKGGAQGTLTEGNIGVEGSADDNSLTIKLAEKVDLGENGSLKTGATTVNNDGVKVEAPGKQPVSLTSDGLNNGGNTIANVGAGKNGSDAVNVSQLTPLATALGANVDPSSGTVAAPLWNVTKTDGSKYDGVGTIQGALDQIGTEIQKPITFAGNSGSTAKKLGESFTVKGALADDAAASSQNLRTKVGSDGQMLIELAESPKFGDITVNNNGKISGVEAGEDEKDAVNKGQLDAVQNVAAVKTKVHEGDGVTVKNKGSESAPDYEVALNDETKQSLAKADSALQNFKVAVNGADVQTVANADTVKFVNGTGTSAAYSSDGISYSVNKSGLTTDAQGKVTAAEAGDHFATAQDVADAINQAAARSEQTTSVAKGSNTHVQSKTEGNNTEYTVSADKAVVSVGSALKLETKDKADDATEAVTTEYSVDLADSTKADIQKGVEAKTKVDSDGLTFTGDSGSSEVKKLGSTVAVKGDAKNITTEAAADGITVKLNDDINVESVTAQNVTADTVKAGDSKLASDGLTIANGNTEGKPVSLTKNGLDNGGNKIANVGAGNIAADSQEAVNGGQLFAQGEGVKNIIGGNTVYNPDTGVFENTDIGGTGKGNVNDAIAAVKAGVDAGWNLTAQGGNGSKVASGETVDLRNEDGNIKVSKTADADTVTFDLANDIKVDSVTAGDSKLASDGLTINNGNTAGKPVSLTKNGLDNGGNKIANVGAGNIAADSQEAVNGSQLYNLAGNVTSVLGDAFNIDGAGNITAGNIGGTGKNTVDEAVKAAFDQANAPLTFSGDNTGSDFVRKLGTTVGIKGGADEAKLSDNNIGVVSDGQGTLTVKLAKELNIDSVSAGDTVLNNDGVKVGDNVALTSDGLKAGDVNIGSNGIDAGGKQISNVKDGEADGDAVNLSQLKKAAAAAANKVAAGDNIEVAEEKQGDGSTTYTVKTKRDVDFDSVTSATVTAGTGANRVVLDNNGVNVGGDTYISGNGLNANKRRIANVADGRIGADSQDAVNGSQLYGNAASVANIFGGNAAVNPDGSLSMSDVGGTGAANVNDAIRAVNQAAVEAKTTVSAGSNIVVTPNTNPDGSTNYTVATAKDLTVDSVKAGNTVLDNDGVKVGGNVALTSDGLKAGDVNISSNGINAGGNKVSNVADGEVSADSTDAVNGRQLFAMLGGSATAINTVAAPATQNTDGSTTPAGTVVTNVTNPDGSVTTTTETNQTVAVSQDKGGNQYTLTTYNVEGQNMYVTNDVIQAVGKMNEQGIKFFHTNDGEVKPVVQGHNQEDSSAAGAYATAIGYQSSASGQGAVAMGNTYTAAVQAEGAQVSEVKDASGNVTGYAQRTLASGERSIAIGTGSQALSENAIAIGTGNVVTGKNSGAIGDPTVVTGDSSYSVGNNNTVSASNAYALGSNIKATVVNSVYLGDNAASNGVNTTAGGGNYTFAGANDANVAGVNDVVGVVSVGTEGQTRQVQNVAAGVVSPTSTDAINGSQLHYTNQAINNVANYTVNMGNQLNQRINDVEDRANAGAATAMAVAGLPQAYLPGKSMIAVAGGTYRGESGYAVGYSSISDNGNWIIKGSATGNSRGHYGATAGVGYQW